MQLPILLSRPTPALAEREAAVRLGAAIGVVIECVVITALGFGILKKKVWAVWSLFVLAVIELVLNLLRQEIRNAALPLILLSLVLWTANSLRARANDAR